MLEDGIYGLQYTAARSGEADRGSALAVLRAGKILGSDPWGGVFVGSCEFDPEARLNKVRLQFDVPPEGTLVTGFSAGPTGAVLDIVGAVARAAPDATMVVDVAGAPVSVRLTYLGPLPNQRSRRASGVTSGVHERQRAPHPVGPHRRSPRHSRRRADP
jgi:hypothetical protein